MGGLGTKVNAGGIGLSATERAVLLFLLWMALLSLPLLGHSWMSRGFSLDVGLIAGTLLLAWSGLPPNGLARTMFPLWVVLPVAYTQAGNFGTRWVSSAENFLLHWDRAWFGVDWMSRHPPGTGWWTGVLECAYLSNYFLVFGWTTVMAFVVFWNRRRGKKKPGVLDHTLGWIARHTGLDRLRADVGDLGQWLQGGLAAAMTALLLCYAAFPVVPAITPRLYLAGLRAPAPMGAVRGWNHWLLAHFSVPWGILPSGHVAGPTAMACVFLLARKWRLAVIYFAASGLIAVAIVHGNYHFVCDAMTGALTGLSAALLVLRQMRVRALAVAIEAEAKAEQVAA